MHCFLLLNCQSRVNSSIEAMTSKRGCRWMSVVLAASGNSTSEALTSKRGCRWMSVVLAASGNSASEAMTNERGCRWMSVVLPVVHIPTNADCSTQLSQELLSYLPNPKGESLPAERDYQWTEVFPSNSPTEAQLTHSNLQYSLEYL
eukprot:Gb_24222 [translate_table: standard]